MTALAPSAKPALKRPSTPAAARTALSLKPRILPRDRFSGPVTTLLRPVKPADGGWNPALAQQEAAPFGFRIAGAAELVEARAVSEAIMGMTLCPIELIAACHARTGGTGWVHTSKASEGAEAAVTGVILLLPLSEAGEADLREGRFQPRAPEPHQLCAPGEPFPAIYFWLFAGKDGPARRNIIRTSLAWRNGAYAHVRGYARAASVDGFRTMSALGFEPMPSSLSHLFFIDKRA